MPNPQSTFAIGTQVAVEATYSLAPSTSKNPNWWQGGRWMNVTAQDIPDLWDNQATIFPQGRSGSRARRNRRPIVGRRWSEGGFNFDVTIDFLAMVAYGALGSLSSNMVPSTDFELLNEEPIPADTSKNLVLASQPSDGGAILRFWVSGTSAGGWISLSGIDADGNGASEVISFTSGGSFYSRISLSAVGASSIQIWSNNTATLDIQGIQYWEHTISVNETSNPSFSVQRLGDPTAGATSKMRLLPGLVVTDFSLNAPAEARDGLLSSEVNFEGNPTATCDAPTLPSASPALIFPAWVTSITREGESYTKALDFSFDYDAGNRNYRTAAGTQNPQGAVYLSQELTGSMRLLSEDESEYNKWKGASVNDFVVTFTSPYKLNTGNFLSFTASMNSLYFEEVDGGEDDDLQVLEVDFATINDADTNLLKMYFKTNVPGTAYGNSVS